MGVDGNTLARRKAAPAVLQVVPRLGSGGAGRGTVDIAGALVDAGWTCTSPLPAGRWSATWYGRQQHRHFRSPRKTCGCAATRQLWA